MILPPNTIIAAGPVIIEGEKVLLNREKKDYGISQWFFPGGGMETFDTSLEDVCKREVKEEMGIDIEIIRPMRTLIIKRNDGVSYAILAHYLAKRTGEIQPGHDIVDWGWHDVNNLPDNCADNVKEIIKDYLSL